MTVARLLVDLVRYWALPYNRPPVGEPPARIEVFTARGKRVLTPSIKRAGTVQAGRLMSHQEQSDDTAR